MDQKMQLKIQLAEKEAQILRLKLEQLEIAENGDDDTIQNVTESPLDASPQSSLVPEEYPLQDVYVADDYVKLPRKTPLAEVVRHCVSIGSRAFVGPHGDRIGHSQWYIRSPPDVPILASGRSRRGRDGTFRGGTYTELRRNMAATDRAARLNCCTYLLNY